MKRTDEFRVSLGLLRRLECAVVVAPRNPGGTAGVRDRAPGGDKRADGVYLFFL